MEIQTNRVTATFDFSAIAKDFTIFRVFSSREPGQWKQWNQDVQTYCVLDAPVITWKALATAYGSQYETLVLFAAGTVDVPQFEEFVKREFHGFEARPVSRQQLIDADFRAKHFGKGDRLLAQLFLNRLGNFQGEEQRVHNIAGSLYRFCKKKKDHRIYYQFRITASSVLRVSMKTFSKDPKGAYLLDAKTHLLRKHLQSDSAPCGTRYADAAHSKQRNVQTFLSIQDLKQFYESRLGQLWKLMKCVREELSPYMTLTLQRFSGAEVIQRAVSQKRAKREQRMVSQFQNQTLFVQSFFAPDDTENMEHMKDLLADFQKRGMKLKWILPEEPAPENCFCVFFLYPRLWYQEHEQNDPYAVLHQKQWISQVVTSDALEQDSSLFLTLMDELFIKRDIKARRVQWEMDLSFMTRPWNFVDAQKRQWVDAEGKKHTYCVYTRMTLSTDGSMQFDTFDERQETPSPLWQKIALLFQEKPGQGLLASEETIAGLVYADDENMHVIVRTNTWVLPNMETIQTALRSQEKTLRKEMVWQWMAEAEEDDPSWRDFFEGKRKDVEALPDEFPAKKLGKIFSARTTRGKQFAYFVYERHGFAWQPLFKSFKEENRVYQPFDYQLDAMHFIHKIPHERMFYGAPVPVTGYFSGMREGAMKSSIARGSLIYDIVPEQEGHDQSAEILPLLDVDFVVSSERYTVLPFPFKYLREYRKWYDVCHAIMK